jgi:hypothetical protein
MMGAPELTRWEKPALTRRRALLASDVAALLRPTELLDRLADHASVILPLGPEEFRARIKPE